MDSYQWRNRYAETYWKESRPERRIARRPKLAASGCDPQAEISEKAHQAEAEIDDSAREEDQS